jgi:hypothetical protein
MKNTVRSIAFVACAVFLASRPLSATSFDYYDKLDALLLQPELLAVMVDATQKALRDAGQGDLAARMEQLFTTPDPGEFYPSGLAALDLLVARGRVADIENLKATPPKARIPVEAALFLVLRRSDMELPVAVRNAVLKTMDGYRPQSYAEFRALPAAEQRSRVALLAKYAVPLWLMHEAVDSMAKKRSPLLDDARSKQRAKDLMARLFPYQSPSQQGFTGVAGSIAEEFAKTPAKQGVFSSMVLYVLDQLEGVVAKEAEELDKRAIRIK